MESVISLVLAAAGFISDQKVKKHIEKNYDFRTKKELLSGGLIIRKSHNSGFAMNGFERRGHLVLLVSGIVFMAVLVLYAVVLGKSGRGLMKAGLGLIAGGAASNVYDRWKQRFVVDYFSFGFLKKIVFNLADMYIIIGCLLVFAAELRGRT